MSNIIDFNKRRREHMQQQPMNEVSLEALLQGLTSAPRNDLMADVANSVREKMTRLLIMTDIASKASEMLAAYGFDPNNFYLESDSMERYLSGEMDEGEDALWNGPFFDWDADDENDTTVRVLSTIRTTDEDDEDISIQLALELFKLGKGDKVWSRFNDGEWVQDGPPADLFDSPDFSDFDEDDDDDGDGEDEDNWEEWYANEDPRSIYMYDFSNASLKALTLAGIDNVDQIKAMTDAQLSAIPGITEKDLKRIRTVLSYDEENS
ncbi:MAG: helix-hairpin-helix domain-containing protein [Clostridia bacterium]|nr:helix-hairpin-helix domain-containing protein [Clostridia bacterium]